MSLPRRKLIFLSIFIVILFIYFGNLIFGNNQAETIPVPRFRGKKLKFNELVNAVELESCSHKISVVIMVLCGVRDKFTRDIIRQTWGQWISSQYSSDLPSNLTQISYHSNVTRLIFVLGSETTEEAEIRSELKHLRKEAHFKDIMYFPHLKDNYLNLTMKTLTAFDNARKTCPNATYFLKADTDVFINIPRLLYLCDKHLLRVQSGAYIIGNEQFLAQVIRDPTSKWFIPKEVFAGYYFPNYVVGCGYILSKQAVNDVVRTASSKENLFVWEDVAITGIYSPNTTIINSKLFRYESYMNLTDSCNMQMLIVAHRISPVRMATIWNDINNNTTSCNHTQYSENSFKKYQRMVFKMI